MGLSVVVNMTLGIVVDDIVHFLSKWLHARCGLDPVAIAAYPFAGVRGVMCWFW